MRTLKARKRRIWERTRTEKRRRKMARRMKTMRTSVTRTTLTARERSATRTSSMRRARVRRMKKRAAKKRKKANKFSFQLSTVALAHPHVHMTTLLAAPAGSLLAPPRSFRQLYKSRAAAVRPSHPLLLPIPPLIATCLH